MGHRLKDVESMRKDVLNRSAPSRNGKAKRVKSKRKTNRFSSVNLVVDHHLAELSGAETKVYLTLWRWVDSKSGTVSISHQQLADLCGVTRITAIRSMKALTKRKLVRRIAKGSAKLNTPNKYVLLSDT